MSKFTEWKEYRRNKKIAKRELARISATALPVVSDVADNASKISKFVIKLVNESKGLGGEKLLTMVNITTAIGRVYKAITENKIINDYNTDINFVYNQLELFSIIDQDNFRLRFNAVDLVFQYRLYCNMSESKDISWLIDLRDPDTVKGINNKYFTDNPLDLNAL